MRFLLGTWGETYVGQQSDLCVFSCTRVCTACGVSIGRDKVQFRVQFNSNTLRRTTLFQVMLQSLQAGAL